MHQLIANPTYKSDSSVITLGVLVGVLVILLIVNIIVHIYCLVRFKNYSFKIQLKWFRPFTTQKPKLVLHYFVM